MNVRLLCIWGWIVLVGPAFAAGEREPLLPQEAFPATARMRGAQTIEVRFHIAKGYYLYRDKLRFTPASDLSGLGAPSLPRGTIKEDEFFGKAEIYHGDLTVKVPLVKPQAGRIGIKVEAQGCAEIIGVCYPPFEQVVWTAFPGTP